jgi:hypothetical protein
MPRALLLFPALLALSLGSARALAEDAESAPNPHYHNHDGFYLSLALGPSYVSSSLSSTGPGGVVDDTTNATSSSIGTTISGTALGGQLLIGGTPVEGLVVGGGTMGNVVFGSNRSWNGTSRPMNGYSAGLLGPFVDYYFDPHEGLHLQVLAGLADVAENSTGPGASSTIVWGYGGSIGFGNDWWIGPDWSLGILFRGQVARLSTSIPSGTYGSSPGNEDVLGTNLSESQTLWTAGLLMTATYQ